MIITNDEDALRIECTDVSPNDAAALIEQLERELKLSGEYGRAGIGLAASQIGIPKNCAIVRVSGYSVNLVNCKIEKGYDLEMFEREGCLSFPGRFEETMRYQEIVVRDNSVGSESFIASGLLAVVIQHEMDHMIGKLLTDIAIKKPSLKKKKLRPNDLCDCNSGKKYKKCCAK